MACNRSIACHWQDPREIWLFDNYQKAHTQIYYLVNFPCGLLTFHAVWKLSILSGNFWFCLETPTCESGWHFQILPYVYSSATSGATLHKLDACIESSIHIGQPKWVQIKIFIGKPTMRVLLTEHFLWAGNPSVGRNICQQVFELNKNSFTGLRNESMTGIMIAADRSQNAKLTKLHFVDGMHLDFFSQNCICGGVYLFMWLEEETNGRYLWQKITP